MFKTVKFISYSQLSIIANYQLVAMDLRIGVYIYIIVIYNHTRERYNGMELKIDGRTNGIGNPFFRSY